MAVESADYIGELDPQLPQGTDSISEADDHMRLTKRALTQTFPGTASDPWDQALRVGPRALNAMADINLADYVTTNTNQQIGGSKTFLQPVTCHAYYGADGNLIGDFSGATAVGRLTAPTWLMGRNDTDVAALWGPVEEGAFATILHQKNFWRLMINTLYPVFSVIMQTAGMDPGIRFPGTGWRELKREDGISYYQRVE